jgi:hypothetical protein
MAEPMTKADLSIDRRLARGATPLGEALNVHRGGGRFISIIGKNNLFHNPDDGGPDVIDTDVIARFATVFAGVATALARD